MRTINGKSLARAALVVEFEFTQEEIDSLLVLPELGDRLQQVRTMLSMKTPVYETSGGNYNLDKILEAAGKAMIETRMQELKQIPEKV